MDERMPYMAETEELVKSTMKRLATVERAGKSCFTGLLAISKVFPEAYSNGHMKGGAALKRRDRAIELAGKYAALHSEVISFHEELTADAIAAGKDQPGEYAELPNKKPGVPTPKSGDR